MEEYNINYGDCIKQYDEWGKTNYVNICTQEETTVKWGLGEYALSGLLISLGMLLVVLIVWMIRNW